MIIFLASGMCFAQSVKTDTVKKNIAVLKLDTMSNIELALKVMEHDSALKAAADTIAKKETIIKELPVKPAEGSEPIAWIDYIIALAAFLVLWILSKLKYLQGIEIPIIQRLVSETSAFIKKIQNICLTISTLIPVLMSLGVITGYTASILGNIEIICLGILGFTMFTTKKPELQK